MPAPKPVIRGENAWQDNAEEIRQQTDDRLAAFILALDTEQVVLDEKEDERDEGVQRAEHIQHCNSDLKSILAQAAAVEARARAR